MESNMDSVTDSELIVLRAIWQAEEPMSASQVVERVTASTEWSASTIRTLLRRLQDKEVLTSTKEDVIRYSPRFSEKEYGAHQASKLIREFYSGSAGNLIATLHGQKQLSEEDIAELKRFIEGGV